MISKLCMIDHRQHVNNEGLRFYSNSSLTYGYSAFNHTSR